MSEQPAVHHNRDERRYAVQMDGAVAYLAYRDMADGRRALVHTEVPAAFEGRGIGGLLVKTALEGARSERKHVIPSCPFVKSYIVRHPEYAALVG